MHKRSPGRIALPVMFILTTAAIVCSVKAQHGSSALGAEPEFKFLPSLEAGLLTKGHVTDLQSQTWERSGANNTNSRYSGLA